MPPRTCSSETLGAAEHGGDGEAVGHDGETGEMFAADEETGESLHGRAGVEKDGARFRQAGGGEGGDAALGAAGADGTLAEGGEGRVVVGERAAVRAG
ncbi:MAG: hypothetical protein WDM96_18220 [Lacunisphaera sp.]